MPIGSITLKMVFVHVEISGDSLLHFAHGFLAIAFTCVVTISSVPSKCAMRFFLCKAFSF
jgi:hypothetical protein